MEIIAEVLIDDFKSPAIFKSVVLPDCRGPVTTIAGKVFMALKMTLDNTRAFIG